MPMPRRCLACTRTYKNNFNAHARKCPRFSSWQLLDRDYEPTTANGK